MRNERPISRKELLCLPIIGVILCCFLAPASIATVSGIIFAKIMNLFMKEKINPLLGAAGVSDLPGSTLEVHMVGLKEDSGNYLLMHAMACNASGVIGTAICAGVLWSFMMR